MFEEGVCIGTLAEPLSIGGISLQSFIQCLKETRWVTKKEVISLTQTKKREKHHTHITGMGYLKCVL